MNRKGIIILAILIIAAACGTLYYARQQPASSPDQGESAVRAAVAGFGAKLKDVSLLQPPADLRAQLQAEYSPYLAPELIARWQASSTLAFGRTVSSPWPDRIEITSVARQPDGSYAVAGNVIEITSADAAGTFSASYPVAFTAENRQGTWLITEAAKGAYR